MAFLKAFLESRMNKDYRISELQTSEGSDVEDENILAFQTKTEKVANINKQTDKCEDNDIDEATEECPAMSSSIQFSIKEEVENCGGSDTPSREVDGFEGSTYAGSFSTEESVVNSKETANSQTDDNDETEETFIYRKVLPYRETNVFIPVKQYTFTKNVIRKAIEVQSSLNTEQCDKYLDIAMRNFYGEFKESTKLFHDKLINQAIERWKDWYETCPDFGDTPLLYICYICSKGWWRLYPFREHIREHNESILKIKTEPSHHEFFVAAFADQPLEAMKIEVDSNCWKCGKDAKYHAVSKRILKYKCDGCDTEFMTCTKLAQHEGLCEQYLRKRRAELSAATSEYTMCPVCFLVYVSQREMKGHMIQYHSVRSDEPVSIQVKRCKACGGCYHVYKYHECPKKKTIKCGNCCKRFTTKVFQQIHMQFNKGFFHCTVCGINVEECVGIEHMVHHSNNYALLHMCLKCKDQLIYSEAMLTKHMKRHERWYSKHNWSAMIPLPTICIKGEIVKSEKILIIPRGDLYNFLRGLPTTLDIKSIFDITIGNTTKDVEHDTIILEDDDDQPLYITEEPKIQEIKSESYSLQAQLDAEIKRDVEMEASISEIIKASNSYQKLLKKEKEEPMEEDLYKDNVIISDDCNEVVVISDSDYEEPPALQAQLDAEIQRDTEMEAAISEIIKASNSHQNLSKKETEEPMEDGLYKDDLIISDDCNEVTFISDSDFKEPTVKEEIEKVENSVKVKKQVTEMEDYNSNQDTVVKEEPETYDGDDETLRRSAKEKRAELSLQDYMNINQDTESEGAKEESDEFDEDNDSLSSKKQANLFGCGKCVYRGTHFHFIEHITKFCAASFDCSICSKRFPTLVLYIRHLERHNQKHLTCLECQDNFNHISNLSAHIKTHLRRLFVKVPLVQDAPAALTNKDVFQCIKCDSNVPSEQFFNHWESHLMTNSSEEDRYVEEDISSVHSEVEVTEESMNPKLMKEVLDLLLIRDKRLRLLECIVCNKQLKGRDECKRHLIMHLLSDALLRRGSSDNKLRCQLCKADNPTINKYKQHMREHAWLPLYKCDLCSKCFSDSSGFSAHWKSHNKLSFICDSCGSKFNTKVSLIRHLKMHKTGPAVRQKGNVMFYNEVKF